MKSDCLIIKKKKDCDGVRLINFYSPMPPLPGVPSPVYPLPRTAE